MATTIDLQGRKILVTGGGRGIGRSICERLYKHGAIVYALSRTKSHLDDLKAKCPTINILVADLEDWNQTRQVVESIGPVDAVVNNAAMGIHALLLDCKPEDYDKMWKTNVSSVLNISQVVAKGMIETGTKGSIVNISSNLSGIGVSHCGLYASTKAALDRLTRSMALEWGKYGIRANTIHPTVTDTDMVKEFTSNEAALKGYLERTPLGRILQPDDVTDAVMFMLSDLSAMITADSLTIDGGYRWN